MDRRIVVKIMAEGHRDPDLQGEYVHGAITDLPMWARRRDVSEKRKIDRGGTRIEVTRDWRVRWNALLASTPISRLMVVEGTETFRITNKVELTAQRGGAPDLRRRWIDLSGRYQ